MMQYYHIIFIKTRTSRGKSGKGISKLWYLKKSLNLPNKHLPCRKMWQPAIFHNFQVFKFTCSWNTWNCGLLFSNSWQINFSCRLVSYPIMIYALNWVNHTWNVWTNNYVFYFLKNSIIVINIVIVTDIFRLFWLKSWLISTCRIYYSFKALLRSQKPWRHWCYDPVFLCHFVNYTWLEMKLFISFFWLMCM